jgi:hypothetical protein
MLVRKGGRKAEEGERAWFLFKERDEHAKPGKSITEEQPFDHFTIENIPARLARLKKDPRSDMAKTKQSIIAAMLKRLQPH